jgi:hypothetical protein
MLRRVGVLLALAIAAAVFAFATDPRTATEAWLAGFGACAALATGGLYFLMIGHVTRAGWFVPLRGIVERITASLPFVLASFVLVLVAAELVYPWAARVEGHYNHAWLDRGPFVVRYVAYSALLLLCSETLLAWSRRQERTSDPQEHARLLARMQRWSAIWLPLVGIVFTFAAIDWFMSIEPSFFSTMYAARLLSSGFTAAVGLVAVTIALSPSSSQLGRVTSAHRHALGRVLFAAVCFTTYLAFSELLLIWMANLPW